jgi:hypothetical protein
MEDPMFEHRSIHPAGRRAALSRAVLLTGTLALAGCGIFESSDPFAKLEVDGDIGLSADGDTVVFSLTVGNPTRRDLVLNDGSGLRGIALEVHALPAAGGGMLWRNYPPRGNMLIAMGWTLPAGRATELGGPRKLPVSIILGDSIPPGRYELRLRPHLDQRIPEEGLMPVELTLGGSPGAAVARLNQGARRSP